MSNIQAISDIAPAVRYQPTPKRYYFDLQLRFRMSSNSLPSMGSSSVDRFQPCLGKENLIRGN